MTEFFAFNIQYTEDISGLRIADRKKTSPYMPKEKATMAREERDVDEESSAGRG